MELCQGRVAAERKIVALNGLVLVLGTDCCNSNNGIEVTEEMRAGNLNCIYCTSGTLCCPHVPLLNSSCLRSDPLAAGFNIKNVFWIAAVWPLQTGSASLLLCYCL